MNAAELCAWFAMIVCPTFAAASAIEHHAAWWVVATAATGGLMVGIGSAWVSMASMQILRCRRLSEGYSLILYLIATMGLALVSPVAAAIGTKALLTGFAE